MADPSLDSECKAIARVALVVLASGLAGVIGQAEVEAFVGLCKGKWGDSGWDAINNEAWKGVSPAALVRLLASGDLAPVLTEALGPEAGQ